MNSKRFLLVLVVFCGLYGLVNLFVYRQLAVLAWPRMWTAIAIWLLAAAFPLSRVTPARKFPGIALVSHWAGAVWMGAVFLLAVIFALGRMAYALVRGMTGGVAGGLVAWNGAVFTFALIVIGIALYQGLRPPRATHARVDLSARYGLGGRARIVFVSDVHLGHLVGKRFLRNLIKEILERRPDLVLIGGDVIDPEMSDDEGLAAILGKLKASGGPEQGVFAVTGNHEFYTGVMRYRSFLRRADIPLLENARVDTFSGLQILGIHDPTANGSKGMRSDLPAALAGLDPSRPSLLMSHQPKNLEAAVEAGVDVVFSGHTHGGQIFPFHLLVRLAFDKLSGRHRLGPRTELLISKGTGFWGPPMRLGSRSEYLVVDLKW